MSTRCESFSHKGRTKSFKCVLLQVPVQFEIKDQSEPQPRGVSPGVPPADGPGHFQLWSKTPCTDPA